MESYGSFGFHRKIKKDRLSRSKEAKKRVSKIYNCLSFLLKAEGRDREIETTTRTVYDTIHVLLLFRSFSSSILIDPKQNKKLQQQQQQQK